MKSALYISLFLSADLRYQASIISARCVHRTSRHAIAMMFLRLSVGPSVCLSVCLGRRACIVIIRCTLARIHVYCLIVQCSGHHDTKACPPILPAVFFQFHLEDRWGIDVQTRPTRDVNTVIDE